MSKSERRGFLSFFSRNQALKEKVGSEDTGANEEDTVALSSFSKNWFGRPKSTTPSKETDMEKVVKTAEAETKESEPTEKAIEDVTHTIEQVQEPTTSAEQQGDDTAENIVHKSAIGLFAKIGIPVAIAAAACAVIIKLAHQ